MSGYPAPKDKLLVPGVLTPPASSGFWPGSWWRIVDTRVGIIPLPIYVVLLALIAGFVVTGRVPSDLLMSIVILAMGGFTCAELGKRLPGLRHIGAAAILATFVPSALAYYHLLPAPILASVTEFTKVSNFLYLFIAAIIVGSILGMDRRVLIAGFVKIFIPLAAGTVAAGLVGTLVGTLLGLGAWHTFFFVVVPIMAGGVGEGAIPLSIGYAAIMHQPQGDLFAQVLPPVMLGSLTAILLSGILNMVVTCPPRSVPPEVRLRWQHGRDWDGAQASQAGGDRRQAAAGRSAGGTGQAGGRGCSGDRGDGGDVLPLACRVWRAEAGPGASAEGSGAGERAFAARGG